MRALTVYPGSPGSGGVREVADPTPAEGEVLVEVIRTGVCGTDSEIERGEYGSAPDGDRVLVLGHECLGRLADGSLVVPSVRRPDGCPECLAGEQDMCLWGRHKERGINGLHGFCAERFAERPEYLVPVPRELEDIAVLLEPLTVGEKALRHAFAAQQRMRAWRPERAIVTGAGPVGLLAAIAMRLRGLEVTVVERAHKPERATLLQTIGARYAVTARTPFETLGPADIIFEATGSSGVAFGSVALLNPNGALILTSVTGGGRSLDLPADELNKRIVLQNLLILGSVNANAQDFRAGIEDLRSAEARWPGLLATLITRRVPLADAATALQRDPRDIKTVVEVAA